MIKELKLKNWKSFSEATVYVDRLTILIGTNASGKSNLLDALLFLQRIAFGRSLTAAIAGDAESSGIRGGLEWVAKKPDRQLRLEALIQGSNMDKIEYRYVIEVSINGVRAELVDESLVRIKYRPRSTTPMEQNLYHTNREEVYGVTIPTYINTGTRGPGKRFDLHRDYCILSQLESQGIRKEVLDGARTVQEQLQRIFILDPIPSHMRNYSTFSDKVQTDGANIAGVLAALPEDRKEEVEATVTHYLKRLPERDIQKIWTEPIGKFGTDAMLYCEEQWSDKGPISTVDLRGMSDGTLRFLAIIVAMLTQEKHSLLVVEEVDNGLHPSRAHVLIQMLKELGEQRTIDVIVTTHNPAVLDALGSQMVPFISVVHRESSTGASTISLLEELDALPKLMAGGTLGRLVTQGKIESALKEK